MKTFVIKSTALILVSLAFLTSGSVYTQKELLKQKIEQIAQSAKGKVGVAVLGLEDKYTLSVNGNNHFPMQSVYKFPLAMAILDKVDKGK
jgi:beta-lactamase class A